MSTLDIKQWCADRADHFKAYETRKPALHEDRDAALVAWTIHCLGDPKQDISRDVLAAIAARHGLALTAIHRPTPHEIITRLRATP